MPSPSYRTHTHWQHYQPFFPARARVSPANAPTEEWFDWQGAAIHVDRFACLGAPLTVIVLHGAGGYGRLFAPLGKLLHAAGYEVIAPDLPGYGLSKTNPALVNYHTWVDILCDLVASEHQRTGRRIVLFGGSLGGYLAYLCAARLGRDRVAGVIATTLADPRSALVQRQFARNALVQHVLLPLMPVFAAGLGWLRLPIKWFTRMHAMSENPALGKLVAADPYGGGVRVPIRFMHSIFTIRPQLEPEAFDVCPVLLAHPANDRWTDIASSKPFFDRLNGPKTLVMLENCGHFPVEEPGITQLEQALFAFLRQAAATG